ncbi:unnamed protein product [Adineta ricciae]|uniref:Uncharacterized protein n=1 Tax=Adineta ricciae TaxID=249248 RepID=A0A813RAS3_ADIRI|nr:unnamed protein product [Adineta ricciae]
MKYYFDKYSIDHMQFDMNFLFIYFQITFFVSVLYNNVLLDLEDSVIAILSNNCSNNIQNSPSTKLMYMTVMFLLTTPNFKRILIYKKYRHNESEQYGITLVIKELGCRSIPSVSSCLYMIIQNQAIRLSLFQVFFVKQMENNKIKLTNEVTRVVKV